MVGNQYLPCFLFHVLTSQLVPSLDVSWPMIGWVLGQTDSLLGYMECLVDLHFYGFPSVIFEALKIGVIELRRW